MNDPGAGDHRGHPRGEGVFDAGTGKVSRATVTRFERDASVTDRGYSTRSYVNVDPGTIGGSDRPPQSGTVMWKRWAGLLLFVR